ncbi:hypothetical protein C9374_007189 [Naegleria lovaniensis]|uniref:Uncharacterized protein n=1 Tax=Naegleria lovaniensis TaxID=51637 RepID=A0AA88H340_NAELO|nr:uncharacterized protein C9374_007189 [Naegleria lovaniensis]KAG2393658.1 hypothetical protein C9374_007189 [Naegleria lovaniensis]
MTSTSTKTNDESGISKTPSSLMMSSNTSVMASSNEPNLLEFNPASLYGFCTGCTERYFAGDHGGYPPFELVENCFKEFGMKGERDKQFIADVIIGIERYSKFIDISLEIFSKCSSKENEFLILNRERTDYSVVLYTLYFLFPSVLPLDFVKDFLSNAMTPSKRQRFILFIYNSQNLTTLFMEEWSRLYEKEWIDSQLLSSIRQHEEIVTSWASKIVGKDKPPKKSDTVFEPFNLTMQKEKKQPVEEVIEYTFKTKEIPETTYKPENPAISKALDMYKESRKSIPFLDEQIIENNRKEISKLREEMERAKVPNAPPRARKKDIEHTMESVTSPKPVIKDIEQVRKVLDAPANVKLNAAAILREEALIRKKQEKEEELLRKYESELRDESAFKSWQENMKLQDEKKYLEEIERKKKEAMESDINARLVRENMAEKNNKLAVEQKKKRDEEIKELKEKIEKEQKVLEEKNKEFAKEIQEKIQVVKHEIKKEKKRTANEIKRESQKNEKIIKQQHEEEQRKREDLIKQIRALVNAPKRQTKTFDRTETSEVGLLAEMSIVQLKERLDELKKIEEQQREERKTNIISKKKEKEMEMQNKLNLLRKHRDQMKKERTTNRMKKLEMIETHTKNAEELRKEALLSLSEKLEQKRELKLKEQRLQEELKQERLKEKQRLHQEKENVEKKHWANQEIGAERMALARIEQSKKEAPVRNTAKRIGLLKMSSSSVRPTSTKDDSIHSKQQASVASCEQGDDSTPPMTTLNDDENGSFRVSQQQQQPADLLKDPLQEEVK